MFMLSILPMLMFCMLCMSSDGAGGGGCSLTMQLPFTAGMLSVLSFFKSVALLERWFPFPAESEVLMVGSAPLRGVSQCDSGIGDVGLSKISIPFCTSSSRLALTEIFLSRDLEAASNLSDFLRLFHFHGLKSLPSAENLLTGFLSSGRGGVRVPEPRLLVRSAAPFCFFAKEFGEAGVVADPSVW